MSLFCTEQLQYIYLMLYQEHACLKQTLKHLLHTDSPKKANGNANFFECLKTSQYYTTQITTF